jgi:hypothetical protein
MTTSKTKLAVLAASLLALATTASAADMSSVKISGFVAASYQYAKTSGVAGVDSVFSGATSVSGWADAAKISFSGGEGPVSGTVSLFYLPNRAADEIGVLDAYLTYDLGSGWSVKGGKYLSPLGYEAFNIPDMIAITYGTSIYAVPAYHSGLELDYGDKEWGAGLGVVDSIYGGTGFFAGDNSLQGNKGIEGYITYKGIQDTVLWAGFAHEGKGGPTAGQTKGFTVLDFWGSYQVSKEASISAEWIYNSEIAAGAGSSDAWLVALNYVFTSELSTTFRLSGGDSALISAGNSTKYTLAPAYKVNDHLTVRAELSVIDLTTGADTTFFGLQGVMKF